MKKALIIFTSIVLLFIGITAVTKTYPVIITDRVYQLPRLSAATNVSQSSLLYGFFPFVLELVKPINCNRLVFVRGSIEKIVLGDRSGTEKQNYSGYHMFGEEVYCII